MSLDLAPEPVDVAPAPAPAAPEPAPVAQPEAAPAPAEATVEDSLSKVWAKHNPARAEDGKFASRETSVKPGEVPPPTLDAKPATEAPPAPAVEAPRAWTAEQKAIWAKLPPEAQPLIAAREAELQEIKSTAGRLAAEYKPLRDTFEAHKDYLSQIGMQPTQWLNNALAVSRALDSGNAATVIKDLARQYSVDLGQIYDPLETPPDPRVAAMERELAQLRNQVGSQQQSVAAQQAAAAETQILSVVEQFKKDNPDVGEIEDEVAAEIQVVRAKEPHLDHAALLKKAFDRAVWNNEATRTKRLEAQVAEKLKAQEATRIAAAAESAKKARSAASVNVSGSPSSSASNDDYETSMRAIWRKNANR